ncbi:ArsR/SmtB family transcription factor [Tindallia californiensis]|uniref:Transcriptional regulator, ArsR family n=1 Tax=Tindallia californiensis TaxID=159292 RepID=A0A1H3JXU4_9FIRM|nr:metalloregulator ArsR/SmtB family transcription factor [Tindallia californiensis]SDY44790.1 transcriptional regulator, ArsR family [Tindallia californiensis]
MLSVQNFLKLISDESRLRILMLLTETSLCVCELEGILNLSQPKVSKVLSKFRDLGLVTDHRKGKFIYYELHLTDPIQKSMIESLKGHIKDLPQLYSDYQRLALKDQFSTSCCNNIEKKGD